MGCWNSSKAKNEKNGSAGTPASLKMKKMGLLELQQGQKIKKMGLLELQQAPKSKNRPSENSGARKIEKLAVGKFRRAKKSKNRPSGNSAGPKNQKMGRREIPQTQNRMNKKLTSLSAIRSLTTLIVFLATGYAYLVPLANVLRYHEQHHLFRFTADYFRQTLAEEGLLRYATNFVVQFFFHPWLGAMVMATLLTLIFVGVEGMLKRLLFGRALPLCLGLVPVLLLLIYTETTAHDLCWVVLSVVLIGVGWLVVALLSRFTSWLPLLSIQKPWSTKAQAISLLLTGMTALGAGYVGFVKHYPAKEGILLQTVFHARQGDWPAVLRYTQRYLDAGKTNPLVAYFHTMALYHAGQLPARLFDYPASLGVQTLYFPWRGNAAEAEFGGMLFEQLGLLNEALHWETEALVVDGPTAPHLVNLARYNIVLGKPRVAQVFIEQLKHTLFYRGQAKQLEQQLRAGRVPHLRDALRGADREGVRFTNVQNLGPELQYLLQHDPHNRMAFDYLMAQLLLSNHVSLFAQQLPRIRAFHVAALPPCYEEALLIYQMGVDKATFVRCGFTVSPDTRARFARYMQLTEQGNQPLLQQEFGRTYWYYLNYLSPYGHQVIEESQEAHQNGIKQL